MKIINLLSLAIAGLFVTGTLMAEAPAESKDGKAGKGGQLYEKLVKDLALTEAQQPKVKKILEDGMKKRQEMKDLSGDEKKEKGKAINEETTKQMKEVLTPEQMTSYTKIMEEMKKKAEAKGEKTEKK